jgi:hypothetical protein
VEIATPSSKTVTVYGFYKADFNRTLANHSFDLWNSTGAYNITVLSEKLVPNGGNGLYFRYTAMEAGLYTWNANVHVAGNHTTTKTGQFVATASDVPPRGFARVAANKQFFQTDDGSPLYLVGGNIECWNCVLGGDGAVWADREVHTEDDVAPGESPPPIPQRPPPNGTFEFEQWFGRLSAVQGNCPFVDQCTARDLH